MNIENIIVFYGKSLSFVMVPLSNIVQYELKTFCVQCIRWAAKISTHGRRKK